MSVSEDESALRLWPFTPEQVFERHAQLMYQLLATLGQSTHVDQVVCRTVAVRHSYEARALLLRIGPMRVAGSNPVTPNVLPDRGRIEASPEARFLLLPLSMRSGCAVLQRPACRCGGRRVKQEGESPWRTRPACPRVDGRGTCEQCTRARVLFESGRARARHVARQASLRTSWNRDDVYRSCLLQDIRDDGEQL